MTNKKRILALAAAVFILMSCFMVAIIPASAVDVSFSYSNYVYQGVDQGAVPYGYYSWAGLLGYYYTNSNQQFYFFELRNTIVGGTRFYPQAGYNNWSVPYSFNQSDFGVGSPVYRFYLPYNNGYGWDFKIIVAPSIGGNVIFDSSSATFYQDPTNPQRGYYEFEWSNTVIGSSEGWYIYSLYGAPVPSLDINNNVTVTFNYVDQDNNFVGSNMLSFYPHDEGFDVSIPGLYGYINRSASGNGYYNQTSNNFHFYVMNANQELTVTVWSVDYALQQTEPAWLTFRYYLVNDNGEREYLTENITFDVPSNQSLDYAIPMPSRYVSAFLWHPSGTDPESGYPVYWHEGVPAGTHLYYDVRVIPLSEYDQTVIDSFKNGNEFQSIVSGARVEGFDQGFDAGFTDGYNLGVSEGGGIKNPLLFVTEPVVAFLNIEVYPGLNLGVTFLAAIAVSLIVVFLKIFSGG